MSKIKVGLAGCGRISVNHFDAIRKYPDDLELVAVCDSVDERAKKAAEEQGCKCYTSIQEMVDSEKLDLVTVCTPSGLHPKHGIIAAKKGINVLTEKPMAVRLTDAWDLINTCDDAGVQLHVVHQNRLNPTIQAIKSAVDKNRFGKVNLVQVNVFWTRPQSYYDAADWRGTWEFDGGAFMNQASHYVDLIDYLVGDVESVMAYTGTMGRKIEAEDSGVVSIKFRNGAIGTMNVTMLTYPKNLEGSITILGDKGTAKIGGMAVNKVEHWEFEDYDDIDKTIFESSYETKSVYGFGHAGYYGNVIESLKTKTIPKVCGRKGVKSLELILAIYKSAKENIRVALPLES